MKLSKCLTCLKKLLICMWKGHLEDDRDPSEYGVQRVGPCGHKVDLPKLCPRCGMAYRDPLPYSNRWGL